MAAGSYPQRLRLHPESEGERLDVALLRTLREGDPNLTRSALARGFAAGLVRDETGATLKPGKVLDRLLVVDVTVPEPEPIDAVPEALPLDIVFEDDHLLVIDKAANMVVHQGPGHGRGTVVNAVLGHLGLAAGELPLMPGAPASRPGIVHRLDRDTSGLLVVAKTSCAQQCLAEQFRTHTIERSYLGIVMGSPQWEAKRLDTSHGRDPKDRRRFAPIGQASRRAITEISLVERLGDAALLRFVLHTGRTHQIRMHARFLGHPIFADPLYGKIPDNGWLRQRAEALGRHALHAHTLGLRHPSGTMYRWSSPLPEVLDTLVEDLRHRRNSGYV